MPNASAKKTKSALKSERFISIIALVACICALAILIPILQKTNETSPENVAAVHLKGQKFSLDVADTDATRMQGLSNRKHLAEDQGMLFIFPAPARQCMWMKDMYISLDIVWLDSQKKVVDTEADVVPDTYPEQFCADNAQYVIELPAGTVQNTGLQVGEQLDF